MTLYDVFKKMGFELPLEVDNNDVSGSLKCFFDKYYNQLTSLSSFGHESGGVHYANDLALPHVVYEFSESLISIISQSTPDNFDVSYNSFLQNPQLKIVLAYLKNVSHQVKTIPIGASFYRVRLIKENEKPFGREGVFHKPFEMIESVGNYRYSIKRVPALYLSNSVFLALEETRQETRLDEPPYAVARFETKKVIKVINVDYSYYLYHRFEEVMQRQTEVILFLGMILPIVAACAIKLPKEHKYIDFKKEYIIPQLLMRFIQEYRNEYQAIRFYSSRIDLGDSLQHKDQYNLVLPTKVTSSIGYDDNLRKLFNMTDVVNIQGDDNPIEVEQKLEQMNAYEIDF